MALFIEIVEGNDLGRRFAVKPGVRIGRKTGEIVLNDSKASGLHAQVEKDAKGQLILVDRDSSNGIRIHGHRVQRVALMPGVKFQVGKTVFHVVQLFGEELSLHTSIPQNWLEVLKERIPRLSAQNLSPGPSLQAFGRAIQLHFLEGIQAETVLVLGYGPRRAGSDVLDIELKDTASPDIAFELSPEGDGARFSTKYPKLVLLNEAPLSSELVNDGDRIRIGTSLIEVTFLK